MPINIPHGLPAKDILTAENIFIMDEIRAKSQDIRPIKLVILNLMPKKIETETQLLRLLGNTPLQLDIELIQTATHISKNTPQSHLLNFYKTFDDIKDQKFDGMIITGAPVEQMDFEEVDYWPELCKIFEWSKSNVFSTLHICWGAQAALYYYHKIPKYPLDAKMFGIFSHELTDPSHMLLYGFDDVFYAPHSRHTEVKAEDILACPELKLLSTSPQAGVYIAADSSDKNFFITGHSEYDRETLANEYFRDINKGLDIAMPANYFPNNDSSANPLIRWRAHSNILFFNWLNYFVYQRTPYNFV